MSIFASRMTKTLEIPLDPPHTITIRALAGRHLGKAQEASQFASIESLKQMGGPSFQKELNAIGDPTDREQAIAKFKADPLNAFDKYALMTCGIVAWSYDEPVTPEAIEDLSDEAVEFFAREILKLSKPSLFQTKDEAEAARGEG